MARERWFEGQLDLDPTRIVFIGETAANTKMARLYGRAPRGERCRAAVPHGHWKTTTFTAGLRYDGIAAPMVLDIGLMNGEALLAYASNKRSFPSCGLATSSSWTICPLIKSTASDRRSRPPARAYDTCPHIVPTLIPIEMAFAKLKARLRAAAARTIPDLWQAIANALRCFTPQDRANYLAAAGLRCNMIAGAWDP